MRTTEILLTTTSFFALMTVSIGIPRNIETPRYESIETSQKFNYDPSTESSVKLDASRSPPLWYHEITTSGRRHYSAIRRHITTTPKPKWLDQQVYMPTEGSITERSVNSGIKPKSSITAEGGYGTIVNEKLRPKPHSSHNHGHVASPPPMKKIVNVGPNRRVAMPPDFDCDDSVAPLNTQDSNRGQTMNRNGVVTKKPCRKSHQQNTSSVTETSKASLQPTINRTPSQTNTSSRKENKEKGGIVFPDVKKPVVFIPRKSKCVGASYCEDENDYPKEYIDSLLQNDIGTRGLFDDDDMVFNSNITQRIDIDDDVSPICDHHQEEISPKSAYNQDGQLRFIVNQENYTQRLQVEICNKIDGPCNYSQNFPVGVQTWCKQRYIYRRLVALNEDGQRVVDSFRLPSCCSCHYKKGLSTRMLSADVTPALKSKHQKRKK